MNHRVVTVARCLSALGLLITSGCRDAPASEGANADAHREVLASVADNVIIPLVTEFEAASKSLQTATEAYATEPTTTQREAVQAAWQSAMDVWQQLELLQVGPAGLMGQVAGGENLRDAIYSWPVVNTCRVDQETARRGYEADLATALANVRGLDALEYLLFTEGAEHTCSAGSAFATGGEWEAIGDADAVVAQRASHALALATELHRSAAALAAAWGPGAEDSFRDKFALAGRDKRVYGTAQEALNALSDAMFYLEKETKDMKLALPAGVIPCTVQADCVESRESRYANRSKNHIITNLKAFRRVFLGGAAASDIGLDDLLEAMGQGELARRLDEEMAAAIGAMESLPGTLAEAVSNAPDEVVAAYDTVRIPVQTFRTEVLSLLDLELPQRAEGDND